METQRSTVQPASLRSEPLKKRIADILRQKIISGEYPLGMQLSEKEIGQELDVSRTPIREALLLLQMEGMVTILPQSGTFVFKPSEEDTVHLCNMRNILEAAAIRLAAEIQDKTVFQQLEDNIEESGRWLREGRLEACHGLDTQFHRMLIQASGNPFLIDGYKIISDRLLALRQLLPLTQKRIASGLKQHKQIVDAIKANDLSLAEAVVHTHVDNVKRMLLDSISE